MAKIHARVTLELDIPDEEFIKIVDESRVIITDACGCRDDLTDIDLDFEELTAERFNKNGTVDYTWDDVGYIPSSWLLTDALNSGLYDNDMYCNSNQTTLQLKEDK